MNYNKSDLLFLGMRNPKKITLSVTQSNSSEKVDIIVPETLTNIVYVCKNYKDKFLYFIYKLKNVMSKKDKKVIVFVGSMK